MFDAVHFVSEYRPGQLARYSNEAWRSTRFALEYQLTHISMREFGSPSSCSRTDLPPR